MTSPLVLMAVVLAVEPGPINDKVAEFARSRLGQKVGNGQCSALAVEALRHAGARVRGRGAEGWGEALPSLRDARAGDILQFEDTTFVRRRTRGDGAVVTLTFESPHHTAVVSGVRRRGRRVVLKLLHQNAGFEGTSDEERLVVREWDVDLAELKGGTIRAYRPVAAGDSGPGP